MQAQFTTHPSIVDKLAAVRNVFSVHGHESFEIMLGHLNVVVVKHLLKSVHCDVALAFGVGLLLAETTIDVLPFVTELAR